MNGQTPPLWELKHISKAFYGVQALKDVSITLVEGEVHALLGENGSGKSTLIKCIASVHQPDAGEMIWKGQPVSFNHPLEARAHGVSTIFQEFSLVPSLTVAENVFLGRQPRNSVQVIDWNVMRQRTIDTLKQLDIRIDPERTVGSLSVAEQQLVEIAKAISHDSSLLIMDEPTAALGLDETRRLLDLIRQLVAGGKAILYISHRLDEVFEIADRITVLKDGRRMDTRPIADFTMDEVVRLMVGTEIEQHYPKQANAQDAPCLEVRDLATKQGVNGVSFTVNRGEVFGLGGMVGSGRTEVARALFGIDRRTAGAVLLDGKAVEFASPSQAIAHGVGLLPENRKADGLFFNFDAPPNITISRLKDILAGPFLSLRRERKAGQDYVGKLKITPTAMDKSVQYLSGGNQQKVVIARWLYSQARLLILDEPTQGIDIGAKLDVYNVINELTANGISILLISSDYPELLAMSDRVAVMRDGKILHVTEASRLTEYQLLAIASGAATDRATQQILRIREMGMPFVHALRDQIGQDVHLAFLNRETMQLLYLDRFGETSTDDMTAQNGGPAPLTCTAPGKLLLAHEPPGNVADWFGQQAITAFTPQTITGGAALAGELDAIRQAGFSLDRGEYKPDARGVAVPIFDETGQVVAALSVTGPAETMPQDMAHSPLRDPIAEAAAQISQALGYEPESSRSRRGGLTGS